VTTRREKIPVMAKKMALHTARIEPATDKILFLVSIQFRRSLSQKCLFILRGLGYNQINFKLIYNQKKHHE